MHKKIPQSEIVTRQTCTITSRRDLCLKSPSHRQLADALPAKWHGWRGQMSVGMFPPVLDHVRPPLEGMSTEVADVRPLRRMSQQMHVLHVRRTKVLLANVTGVRFYARVRGRVSGQVSLRGEHLPALCALVRTAVLFHVAVQVLLRQQPLVANAALELVLVQVHHLSVLVQ